MPASLSLRSEVSSVPPARFPVTVRRAAEHTNTTTFRYVFPRAPLADPHPQADARVVRLSLAQLLHALNTSRTRAHPHTHSHSAAGSSRYLHYLGGGLTDLPLSLRRDVLVDDGLFITEVDRDIPLWIGGRGSAAQLHYDFAHNLYVQVVGRKRFLLAAPSLLPSVQLYPALHPSHRTAQRRYTVSSPLPVHRALLLPGDLLYLPPFTLHQVSAQSWCSVSVSFWSEQEVLIEEELPRVFPRELEPDSLRALPDRWSEVQRAHALLLFLDAVVRACTLPELSLWGCCAPQCDGRASSAKHLFCHLWQERYASLYESGEASHADARAFAPLIEECASTSGATESEELRTDLLRLAGTVATHLDHVGEYMSEERERIAVRLTMLATYAENLVGYLFTPQRAPGFLRAFLPLTTTTTTATSNTAAAAPPAAADQTTDHTQTHTHAQQQQVVE
jgi:Cupin-like domain